MKIKKFLSLLTVATMMLTTCSVTALAADGDVAQIGKNTYATLYTLDIFVEIFYKRQKSFRYNNYRDIRFFHKLC